MTSIETVKVGSSEIGFWKVRGKGPVENMILQLTDRESDI